MELTLTALDALHPYTLAALGVLSFVLVACLLACYADQVKKYNWQLEDYETRQKELNDNAESDEKILTIQERIAADTRPEAPPGHTPYTILFATALILGIVYFFCALSMSLVQMKYSRAVTLAEKAQAVEKPVAPEVANLIEIWPQLVIEQMENGDIDAHQHYVDQFIIRARHVIDNPSDYELIGNYIQTCFDDHADLSDLTKALAVFPVKEEDFVREWRSAAYYNQYAKTPICQPERIFETLHIWQKLY